MTMYELFAANLEKRVTRHGMDKLSEDCVRYDYFSALVESGECEHADLILEYPHPKYTGKEIDCVIMKRGKPIEAVEFKYFPPQDPGKPKGDYGKTDKMGALFADFYRLLDTDIRKKTAVLVSAQTMVDYISNPRNGFDFLFKDGRQFVEKDFLEKRGESKTISKVIDKKTARKYTTVPFNIEKVYTLERAGYTVWVFSVGKQTGEA